MPQKGLVGSRAVVERNYAILPPHGIPESVLPEWTGTSARVLAAPAMGARFAMYLLDLAAGGGSAQALPGDVEAFFYLITGEARLELGGRAHALAPGGFAYLRPGARFKLGASKPARVIWLKKVYEALDSQRPADAIGDEAGVKGEPFMGVSELLLKTLLPADTIYDMAMNIFTFPPGYSLPVTETHFMEHGLYMLEGQGIYYLGDRWHEVEAGDFIWMGPYVPQSFFATGAAPARYLYYKNVNRDVAL
ncbi:MAG TPA: (S)-ureidoglycine aminohydrolase [Candidatus Eisenbacteria bacterium]|jgi:(S)-ureidoglycine aminohydrolase